MDTPISKDEFNTGREQTKLEKRVVAFLQKNKDRAFTTQEILRSASRRVGILFRTDTVSTAALDAVLLELLKERRVLSRKIGAETYYAWA